MTDSQTLSERELAVLRLVAEGATNQQIAHQLAISANTVKVHLRNIYSKLGVVSRTEATVEAVRRGLIVLPGSVTQPIPVDTLDTTEIVVGEAPGHEPQILDQTEQATELAQRRVTPATTIELEAEPEVPAAEPEVIPAPRLLPPPATSSQPARRRALIIVGLALMLIAGVAALLLQRGSQATLAPTPVALEGGWVPRAPLPEPLADMALVYYGSRLYVIGGEGRNGVSNKVWRYDPTANSWEALADKPTPVADVSAAVIGGRIYIPGGRTRLGTATNVVEVYDPASNRWETGTALPQPRSAYALAALEGKLYLFGGREANGPTDTVFVHQPGETSWEQLAAMPAALEHQTSVPLEGEGQILVIGGQNENGAVDTTLRFTPNAASAWQELEPLPEARSRVAAVAVAGTVYLVGDDSGNSRILTYYPSNDAWAPIELQLGHALTRNAVAAGDGQIFTVGGWDGQTILAENRLFKPLYKAFVPIMPR